MKTKDIQKYSWYRLKSKTWGSGLIILGLLILLSLAIGSTVSKTVQAAGTAKFSLSPASGTYKKGNSLIVTISETSDPADGVNTVEADLIYDQAKLHFDSIDTSQSAFDLSAVTTGGSGKVSIVRAKQNSTLTGTQTVASVKFTVLAGSGSTAISFDGRCQYNSNNQLTTGCSRIIRPSDFTDIWDGNTKGGTYTLTGTTTTPTTTKKTTTTTPTPTKTTTTNQTKTSGSTKKTAAPTVTPINQAISLTGYLVAIKVKDNANKPVKAAKVTLDGKSPLSYDASGTASYIDIQAGNHTVVVTAGNKQVTKAITVKAGSPAVVQEFDIRLNIGTSPIVKALLGIAAIVVIIIIIGGGSGLIKSIRRGGVSSDLASHFPKINPADKAGPLPVKEPPKSQTSTVEANAANSGQIIHPDSKPPSITNNSNLLSGQKGK